ncbi:hypothetical protein BDV28DRAFT_163467 [Aspergillus coremiiformis]|uniref:Protein YAE1 n=1 Tax=Aspergillus coremiiformis TaxID=138285 RepID=A0A5N6ZBU1_9EURO|nr:hypothetical protein BDV28DRAFT_163467 [Aspergillus coremiiformis]
MTSIPDPTSLDDIFGSSPPQSTAQAEPSELPALRRHHKTAGYRDGVSAAKSAHVQIGFDAGFPVGAQLGLRAGTVLGIMEGVLRGLDRRTASGSQRPVRGAGERDGETQARSEKRERVLRLYQRAVRELGVVGVFAGGEGGEGGRPEERLRELGEAVVSGWEVRVGIAGWEENMEALEMREEDEGL